jgi:hypothetical protein
MEMVDVEERKELDGYLTIYHQAELICLTMSGFSTVTRFRRDAMRSTRDRVCNTEEFRRKWFPAN